MNNSYEELWEDIIDMIRENPEQNGRGPENCEDLIMPNGAIFCARCADWHWLICSSAEREDDVLCNICSVYNCSPSNHRLNVVANRPEKSCDCSSQSSTSEMAESVIYNSSYETSSPNPTDSEVLEALDQLSKFEALSDDDDGSNSSQEDFETEIDIDDPHYNFNWSMAQNFGIRSASSQQNSSQYLNNNSSFHKDDQNSDSEENNSDFIDNISDDQEFCYDDGFDSAGENKEDEEQVAFDTIHHYCMTDQL